jgi:hypothetical protein
VVAGFSLVAGSRGREHVKRRRRTTLAVLAASVAAMLALGGVASAQDPDPLSTLVDPGSADVGAAEPSGASSFKVVAKGLDNPRGLAIGPHGTLYVAEAGKGGSGPCGPGPEGGQVCYGKSGALTRVKDGVQKRVIKGLPSFAGEGGLAAEGPSDVSVLRKADSLKLIVTIGGFVTEGGEARDVSGDNRFQTLLRSKGEELKRVADLLAYEKKNNPDGQQIDSDPYSLVTSKGKRVVADAGANDLLKVEGGDISTLAVFPDREVEGPGGDTVQIESVPDAVAKAPGGGYYVGELTGFPFPVGEARVYRVVPGSKPKVYAKDFTNIIDVAVGPKGGLYVLEIAKKGLLQAFGPGGDFTGRLVHLSPDGKRKVVASKGLVAPTSVAVGPRGGLYVSNFGIFPEEGQVVRIQP